MLADQYWLLVQLYLPLPSVCGMQYLNGTYVTIFMHVQECCLPLMLKLARNDSCLDMHPSKHYFYLCKYLIT